MIRQKFNLSRFFIINYVLALGVLAVAISAIFSRIGRSNLVSASETHSVSVAQNLSFEIHQHFSLPQSKTLRTFDWRDPGQQRAMDEIARRFLNHLNVVKINIFTDDCRLVYSTNPQLVGSMTRDNRKLLRALRGECVSSLELAREPPDIPHDLHSIDLLETYIPFREPGSETASGGPIIGSFEIYQDVTVLYRQIARFQRAIFGVTFAVMGLLFVILLVIVKKAERIQRRLEAELERHTERLEELVRSRTSELGKEKNRLQVIFDHVPSAFIMLDRRFRIESASAALHALTGRRFEEVQGKTCFEVFGSSDFCETCPTRRAFQSGRIESDVKPKVDAHGEERFLEHVAVPIRRNGETESVLEIITDITERKRLQDQLVRTERLSAAGELAAVIAHEIRNSLTSIKLILQFLSESRTATPREKEPINVAVGAVEQVERVVTELLNFARPRPAVLTTKNLNEVVEESVVLSRHRSDRSRIRVLVELSPEIPDLPLDAEHLKEAFLNLLLNAVQAVPEEGEIRVATGVVRLQRSLSAYSSERGVPITLAEGQRVIQVQVTDNGCGIPPEHLARIFDPFFTTKTNGTGLGLVVARRVVQEHGGVMTVSSELSRGTTFAVFLPLGAWGSSSVRDAQTVRADSRESY